MAQQKEVRRSSKSKICIPIHAFVLQGPWVGCLASLTALRLAAGVWDHEENRY